jgi:hypothetical protein
LSLLRIFLRQDDNDFTCAVAGRKEARCPVYPGNRGTFSGRIRTVSKREGADARTRRKRPGGFQGGCAMDAHRLVLTLAVITAIIVITALLAVPLLDRAHEELYGDPTDAADVVGCGGALTPTAPSPAARFSGCPVPGGERRGVFPVV